MSELTARIARIVQDETLPKSVEAVTSQAAVLSIFDALGWDPWNPSEVTPQFPVRGGQVDYCLRDVERDRNLVLVEVKRTGTDLTGEQEQLLGYAFQENVSLAALTDGLTWWLYLPRADAHWEQRRFYSIDFRQQGEARSAADLERFLGRSAVTSGDALGEAEREFERQERDRRVRTALSQVWTRLITEPTDPHGEMLHDLLAEAVEKEAGHRPGYEEVHQFLLGRLGQEPTTPLPTPKRPRPRRRTRRAATSDAPTSGVQPGQLLPWNSDFTRTHPAAFWLDEKSHEATRWRDVLTGVCDELDRETPRFTEIVSSLRGRRRAYFGRSRSDFNQAPAELKNGLFVDITLNANNTVRRAREVLLAVRGPRGADSFRIELAE